MQNSDTLYCKVKFYIHALPCSHEWYWTEYLNHHLAFRKTLAPSVKAFFSNTIQMFASCLSIHTIQSPVGLTLQTALKKRAAPYAEVTERAVLAGNAEYSSESVTWAVTGGVVFTLTPVIFITGCAVCCYFLNTSHRPVTFTSAGCP